MAILESALLTSCEGHDFWPRAKEPERKASDLSAWLQTGCISMEIACWPSTARRETAGTLADRGGDAVTLRALPTSPSPQRPVGMT